MAKTFAKFDVVAAVKSNARDRVGTPRGSFAIQPKTRRQPRYRVNYLKQKED